MSSGYSQHPLNVQHRPDTMGVHPSISGHTTSDSSCPEQSLKETQREPAILSVVTDHTSKPNSDPNLPPFSGLLVSATTEGSYDELETALSDDLPARTGRVRFRSRVRITSGLNRQRKKSRSEHDYLTFSSSSSSLSGSPSSSISAPLRADANDSAGNPGWGTLGQRVSIFARPQKQVKESSERAYTRRKNLRATSNGSGANERTPLTNQACPSHNAETESNLSREIELVFGPWPRRLTNRHWWWWHMEPIICCHCLVESDDEG